MADFSFSGRDRFSAFITNIRNKVTRKKNNVAVMKAAMQAGRRRAFVSAPVLTGYLRSNIEYEVFEVGDGIVHGNLFVDLGIVPYARKQEYTHRSRAFYLAKGRARANQFLQQFFAKSNNAEKFVLGQDLFVGSP